MMMTKAPSRHTHTDTHKTLLFPISLSSTAAVWQVGLHTSIVLAIIAPRMDRRSYSRDSFLFHSSIRRDLESIWKEKIPRELDEISLEEWK